MNLKTKHLLNELTLIIPAFNYLRNSIVELSTDDKESRDFELTKRITKILARRIISYKHLQQQAVDEWNRIDQESSQDEYNVFMLGLMLLSKHEEVRGKKISLGVTSDVLELQDLAFAYFEVAEINRTADYVDIIYDKIFWG